MSEHQILELGKKRAQELGLILCPLRDHPANLSYEYYRGNQVHKVLGEARFMSCELTQSGLFKCLEPTECIPYQGDTHQGLLIGIKPVKKESAERQFIRELVKRWYADQGGLRGMDDLYARAQDLLMEST